MAIVIITDRGLGWHQYNKPPQDLAETSARRITAYNLHHCPVYETKAENTYAIYPEAFSMFDPYTDMI